MSFYDFYDSAKKLFWFDFRICMAPSLGCFVTFLASKSLIYDKKYKNENEIQPSFRRTPFSVPLSYDSQPSSLSTSSLAFSPRATSSILFERHPDNSQSYAGSFWRTFALRSLILFPKSSLKKSNELLLQLVCEVCEDTKIILVPRPRAYLVSRGRVEAAILFLWSAQLLPGAYSWRVMTTCIPGMGP